MVQGTAWQVIRQHVGEYTHQYTHDGGPGRCSVIEKNCSLQICISNFEIQTKSVSNIRKCSIEQMAIGKWSSLANGNRSWIMMARPVRLSDRSVGWQEKQWINPSIIIDDQEMRIGTDDIRSIFLIRMTHSWWERIVNGFIVDGFIHNEFIRMNLPALGRPNGFIGDFQSNLFVLQFRFYWYFQYFRYFQPIRVHPKPLSILPNFQFKSLAFGNGLGNRRIKRSLMWLANFGTQTPYCWMRWVVWTDLQPCDLQNVNQQKQKSWINVPEFSQKRAFGFAFLPDRKGNQVKRTGTYTKIWKSQIETKRNMPSARWLCCPFQ